MKAVAAQTTRRSNLRGPAGDEVTPSARVRRLNENRLAKRTKDRCRVNVGTAFQSWRLLKDSCGFKSDEEVATYLLDARKANSSSSSNPKIRISKSEIKALIEQEVCKAKAQSDAKLKRLNDSIQSMRHDIHFENTLQKLESQMMRVSKRAEAAIAFIRKTRNQTAPSSDDLDSISRDSAGDATETTAKIDKNKAECAEKSEELHRKIETTKTALKEIRAHNEGLTIPGMSQEEAPPVLSLYKSSTETNDKGKHSVLEKDAVTDLSETEPPALVVPTDSSEETIQGHGDLKRKSEDVSESTEEPTVKKVKEDRASPCSGVNSTVKQELIFYPALPATPFPSSLSIEAASYSIPQKVQLNLALIRNPTRLSVLWNVLEVDPSAPPMESYTIFLTIEKVKGSGIFPRWHSYDHLKATPLPMCALIKKYKPGHKVCAAVVGKDTFGRYGPYSSVVTATMPE